MSGKRNPRGVFEKVKGSGVWWINYHDADGKRHRERVGPKSLAIDAYRIRKTAIRIGRAFPELATKRNVLFSELMQDAVVHSSVHHSKDNHANTKVISKLLDQWFAGRAAKDIRAQEIDRKLSELAESGRAPSTVNHYRSMMSLAYHLGIKNGKVATNPVVQVLRRRDPNARVRFLEPGAPEEEAIREKIREKSPEHESEMDLALNTGMRRSEQYRLRKTEVDFERGLITVLKSKNGEMRHIPMNEDSRAALIDLMARSKGEYVVAGRAKKREGKKDQREWFEDAVEAAGVVNFRYHDLRHTFASRLVMAGVDLRTVQELMGHKDMKMTLRYSHLAPSHLHGAVSRLETKRHQNGKVQETGVSTAEILKAMTT